MSLLQKLFAPSSYALDPRRTTAARRDFDVERGFDRYAEFCRGRLTRAIPPGEDAIAAAGVELLPILSAARAAEVLSAIKAASSGIQPNDKGIDYSEVLAFDRADALLPVFEEVLGGAVDEKLLRQFGSEYLIYSYGVIRTLPRSESRRSFLWHCDRGPRRFLKILLYLNGTESHGGNTEFLDRSTTQDFERLGYVFGPNKRRSADLAPLARKNGIRYEPRLWPIRGGEALLFEPAGALHRGIMPSRGERYLLSLMLTPSPLPWRTAFDAAARTRFCETNAGAWPAHARDLLAAIGLDPAEARLHAVA
jgi:hypothetical protein